MFIQLDEPLILALETSSAVVENYWQHLFPGRWQTHPVAHPAGRFVVHLHPHPCPPAGLDYFFIDSRYPASTGRLHVYHLPGGELGLYFQDGAWVELNLTTLTLTAQVHPAFLQSGRFEDLVFTSLAPLLRQHGYYLLHAFGAVDPQNQGVLIVGPSGSGKTTTGLQLLLSGWSLLSNDVLLLHPRPDGLVYLLPTPGLISIRPFTFELLPTLSHHLGLTNPTTAVKHAFAAGQWGSAVPAGRVYFPQVSEQTNSVTRPVGQALTLAHLMEESLDQWDKATFMAHWLCLEQLSKQTQAYNLSLGRDMPQLTALLEKAGSRE